MKNNRVAHEAKPKADRHRKSAKRRSAQAGAKRHRKAQDVDVRVDLSSINWRRRNRTRLDLLRFCREYLPAMFPLPWSEDQIESAKTIERVALSGECYASAAPRGDGKTQRAKAGALWAILHGHAKYLAVLGASEKMGRRLIREIAQELADNDALAADWPHVCLPIRAAYGKPQRAPHITINGHPCALECGAARVVLPTWPTEPPPDSCGGSVVEGGGVLAAVRGLRYATVDGRTLRPDLLILDDIQTRRSAMSAHQCDERLAVINGDLKRLAGPGESLAAVANVTVIRAGDAADQLLDRDKHPEWHGVRRSMIAEWPKEKDGLWRRYVELRREGQREGDGGKAAADFYATNRAAMDAGGVASWPARYDAEHGELSALQHAFNILADDGEEAFAAECQNQPLEMVRSQYDVTEPLILSRMSGFPRLSAPEGATFIVAAADVNLVGLNWILAAFRRDLACWVVDWGKEPETRDLIDRSRSSGQTEAQAVAGAVGVLADRLNRTPVVVGGVASYPDCLVVDCGFMTDTVLQSVSSLRLPLRTLAIRGRGAAQYQDRKDAIRHGNRWHVAQWRNGRVLVVDSDFWTEQAQRAFLLPVGAPGSCALFGTDPHPHKRLAREIAGVRLVEHVTTSRADLYKWARTPGIPNDLCDALAYAFAASCAAGADMIGGERAWHQRQPGSSVAAPRNMCGTPVRRQPSRVPRVAPE